MTLFVDRKKAFEAKFVHDANLDFKTEARRNALLGHWVADSLQLDDTSRAELVAAYSVQGVLSDQAPCVVARATADMNGVVSADEIEEKLNECADMARQQMS